jgi:gas vesicle protein
MSNNNSSGLLSGLLTGIAIGVSLGLLYAPRPGREIREDLKHRVLELRDRAEEFGDDLVDRFEEVNCEVKSHLKKAAV